MKFTVLFLILIVSFSVFSQIGDVDFEYYSANFSYKDSFLTVDYQYSCSKSHINYKILHKDSLIAITVDCSGAKGFYFYKFSEGKDITFQVNFKTTSGVFGAVRKPVIYLYPKQEITVGLKLNFHGQIGNTYPEYKDGWQVLAKPNGDLINQADNSKHRYLFWDGIYDKHMSMSDFSTGFVVSSDETRTFLDSTLTKIGLTDFEKNDFITFWMPIMKQNNYNFVHFMINQECDEVATLDVSPKPDSELRVYMFFKSLDEPIYITPQNLETIDRTGFVLVEWGGFEFITDFFY